MLGVEHKRSLYEQDLSPILYILLMTFKAEHACISRYIRTAFISYNYIVGDSQGLTCIILKM